MLSVLMALITGYAVFFLFVSTVTTRQACGFPSYYKILTCDEQVYGNGNGCVRLGNVGGDSW